MASWVIAGFRNRIDVRRKGPPSDHLFGGHSRICDPLLDDERSGVEFPQRRNECFASEPAEASVEEAIGTPGYAVAISIVGIGQRQDRRVGHRVQQAEPEDVWRRPQRSRGGFPWHRLGLDAERCSQCGCHCLLDDRPALRHERITEGTIGKKRARVHLDFVAHSARARILVAPSAGIRVEQRSQAGLSCEASLELGAAPFERGSLFLVSSSSGSPAWGRRPSCTGALS